jgi:putative serine protease PepD
MDGKTVQGSSELIVAIRSKQPGDTVTLTVRRDGSEREVEVTLAAHEG